MEDQYFYILLFFLSLELTATSSNYDNTQHDQNGKLVLGIWRPSDKGHIVFSSTNYGGKAISLIHCIHTQCPEQTTLYVYFFPQLFSSLYVLLFGSICLIVSRKRIRFVCFLGTIFVYNLHNLSMKPVNNDFGPVYLINSEKNSGLYMFNQVCRFRQHSKKYLGGCKCISNSMYIRMSTMKPKQVCIQI